MRQRVAGIVAAVVLAALGTGLLVAYVRGAHHRALATDGRDVLVATAAIAKGTKATDIAGRVRVQRIPPGAVASGAVASVTSLAGKMAAFDLVPGEQLVAGRFLTSLAADPPRLVAGMLEVTVALDAVRAVGGQVREGDTVGVLVSFDDPETTHLILHKVAVTGVRTDQGVPVKSKAGDAGPSGRLFVTLALEAPAVERVVFAAEHGRLWLSEEPEVANEAGTRVQNKAAVNG